MVEGKAQSLVPVLVWAFLSVTLYAQSSTSTPRITTPLAEFGFDIGDDYQVANYTQLAAYWKTLAAESERMTLESIGTTAEGRPMYMAVITSPENHANLDRYKEISRSLALAEGVSEGEARDLSREGRAIVWIDGGLHADEMLGAQQLIELVYQMVSRTDEETLRFLDDTILLAVCVNPDGLELVANWYMRMSEPRERSVIGLPRLYQKYAGHDNNRDFYMSSLPETQAINRILYREWFPQIVYNHHQSGPEGTVLFAPPFRDPFNYNYDPLVVTTLDLVAGAMHSRFLAEGKAGATMRSGGPYSTWWNGGLRTSPYFHNMIGILTETIGSPTPLDIPFVIERQLPRGDYPFPVQPQTWHFSQSIEYSMTANRAVLDVASRYGDALLFNMWRMGMNSIDRGSRDHWTITPAHLEFVTDSMNTEVIQAPNGRADLDSRYVETLEDPNLRDARGYIIPSTQPDFPTATRFVNALIKNGITVDQATSGFSVDGQFYPQGSYVVRTAQAFRPHIRDMFEAQRHPDDFPYPGSAPTPPYDMAGWTLAYQMGVEFDRVFDGFDGPFERVDGLAPAPSGRVSDVPDARGFLLSHGANNSFVAVNRLLAEGESVYWLGEPVNANGTTYPAGTIYIRSSADIVDHLADLATELGLDFEAISGEPMIDALELSPVRVGLWDRYGGSESSGWTRFILEDFEFSHEVIYPQRLDRGELASQFDVLIFVDGGIPSDNNPDRASIVVENVPEEYLARFGEVSVEQTIPRLLEFLREGGTILSIGGSTDLARHLDVPVLDALVELAPDGTEQELPPERFFIPGSLLRIQVDNSLPLAFGLGSEVAVVFNNSPAFRIDTDAGVDSVERVAWFGPDPLTSGWAWGESRLEGSAAIVDVTVGEGRLLLFGPEIAFRAQSHGSFKFLFNGIHYGSAEQVQLGN